jgi:DNA-binding beta-propeller fold protein YncE
MSGLIILNNTAMKNASTLRFAIGCLVAVAVSFTTSGCKKHDPAGPIVNNNLFSSVSLLTTDGTFDSILSAVPDASGQFVYFVANATAGTGVYKVPVAGGSASKVFTGAPFGKPMDLALSTDNQTIYVADSASGIYALSISGSAPVLVAGTAATVPVAVDVIQRAGQDVVYYCGRDLLLGGGHAIIEVPAVGASTVKVVYSGFPLHSPAGIVSARNGTLFIANGNGAVYELGTSTLTRLAEGITMGAPAGIALTPDEKVLAVSSKSGTNGTAQVQIIDLATGELSVFNKMIGTNAHPGGLHGARNAAGAIGRYAWAGVTGPGRVYRLEP